MVFLQPVLMEVSYTFSNFRIGANSPPIQEKRRNFSECDLICACLQVLNILSLVFVLFTLIQTFEVFFQVLNDVDETQARKMERLLLAFQFLNCWCGGNITSDKSSNWRENTLNLSDNCAKMVVHGMA